MAIFIDASVFCAYANLRDVNHTKAKSLLKAIAMNTYGRPVTTDYIFDETVTVAYRKAGKQTALGLGQHILDSEIIMAEVDSIIFQAAWQFFKEKNNLSFTDCTILAFMQLFGIGKLATFDKEFKTIAALQVIDS